MTEREILKRLRVAIDRAGNQAAFASQCGVSPQFVSQVLHGRVPVSGRILRALGLTREVLIKERP